MMTTITAVYKDGKFEPLQPIGVPNNTTVTLEIHDIQDENPRPWDISNDPMFALIGAFADDQPLIDGIPVSADPDLYTIAATLGTEAHGLHAWEIAPTRYKRGKDGLPIRHSVLNGNY